ncbi:WD40 repeat domain-containing serine/threonine protein kinase [Streptomyces sp. NPDC087440]|uniref:WD40 repeat domain-containing serine/threonine protein kinase n=1 Tax=Streptomyces sp. NPDC087440 TaxID=3365790 RepID=UPI0037F3D890
MDALEPDDPQWVGTYRLDGRLGAGGMGRVYLGTSPGGRRVAVKVIQPGLASTPQFRRRFAREVEAARRVGGFHTAQVVDADPNAASPWLVTAYIPGPTLSEAVRTQGPFAPDAVLRLGAGLAEGLAAIHRCGLVHRDLKPGNVILAEDGPRIIDFGIARAVDASSLTETGAIVGTYAYMSPEQIRTDRAGPAGDVFSLGSVLAFAATGRSPFDAPSLVEVVQRILDDEPSLDAVEGSLRALLAACLSKDAAHRPSGAELPSLFAELSAGVPARAHVSDDVPTMALSGPPSESGPVPKAASQSEPLRDGLPGVTRPEPTTPYPPAHPPAVPKPAAPAPPTPGMPRRRLLLGAVTAVASVGAVVGIPLLRQEEDKGSSTSGTPGPDPSGAVVFAKNAQDAQDGSDRSAPPGLRTIGFAKDGRTLLGAGDDGVIRRWDVRTRRGTSTRIGWAKHQQPTLFSPDRGLLIRAEENKVRLWDVASGRLVRTLEGPPSPEANQGYLYALAVSPDGRTLVGAALDAGLYVWDPATGRRLDVRQGKHDGPLAISADGEFLTTASPLTLRRLSNRQRVATVDEERVGRDAAAFSPDGQLLAYAETDGPVRLWHTATRQRVATLKGHKKGVNALAFHPSAGRLASGSEDGTVRLWDTAAGTTTATFTCPGRVTAVAFSPDGTSLAAGHDGGPAREGEGAEEAARLWHLP